MDRNKIFQNIVILLLLCIVVESCIPISSKSTKTSKVQPTNAPTSSFAVSKSTNTSIVQVTPMSYTMTPQTLMYVTKTPNNCPSFKFDTQLPIPDLPENYIGYHLDSHDLPVGLEEKGGVLLSDENFENDLVFSEYYWHENRRIFFLQKLICRDESGHAYLEVVDALGSPLLSGNESEPWVCFIGETQLKFSGGFGVYDENLPKEKIGGFEGWPYTEIVFLFLIDFPNQKFIQLDVEGVKCLEGGRR